MMFKKAVINTKRQKLAELLCKSSFTETIVPVMPTPTRGSPSVLNVTYRVMFLEKKDAYNIIKVFINKGFQGLKKHLNNPKAFGAIRNKTTLLKVTREVIKEQIKIICSTVFSFLVKNGFKEYILQRGYVFVTDCWVQNRVAVYESFSRLTARDILENGCRSLEKFFNLEANE